MGKVNFSIFILIVLCFSCNDKSSDCLTSIDQIITHNKELIFTYSGGTEEFIDINNDDVYDFKCVSAPAGNRINKLIVPIGEDNKISSTDNILNLGGIVGEDTNFLNGFNFNDLGAGSNAFLNEKYLGVQFKVDNCTHYGWIKFSSIADGDENSNTPIYYHSITLSILETGYNDGANKPLVIQ